MTMMRRQFLIGSASATSALLLKQANVAAAAGSSLKFNYILASSMYGYTRLSEILPEVKKTGAEAIDIWPKVHGNQREQIDAMGEKSFLDLLKKHKVTVGCITQYKLGPFGLTTEFEFAKRVGCKTIVCGGRGAARLEGTALKAEVKKFAEKMKPHLANAEKNDVTLAIENHGNNLIQSPDSMKWLMEFTGERMGIALAPYHLSQDEKLISGLIGDLGNRISMFYAWQHGMGCSKKLPKEQELLQMPGRGKLDFGPIIDALAKIKYRGWTEIFMHPVPRGIPILDTTPEVTHEINRSREYLSKLNS